jgi:peptide chain release factor subunit 1
MTDDNKIKKVAIDFEPFKPINTSLYLCDNKFHTEALPGLLEDDAKFGFIIMDGMGCLYGTVTGNTREVLHKFSVDLPKKHGRGGQSSVRFARLRVEKRHNYMRKTAEMAVNLFVPDGQVPFVKGIVLGGAAELKNELVTSGLLDQRLVSIIVKSVDTSYGGENGFNQAISLASDALANVKFTEERNLIQKFFDEITMDSGKYCFGLKDTMTALEMSAAETLIIYEDLDVQRYELKHPVTGAIKVLFLGKDQEKERSMFRDPDTDVELETQDKVSLVDWFANNYKNFGAKLEFVTNKSQEGAQFLKGFGGIGGILRWKVDFMVLADHDAIDTLKQLKESSSRAKADIGDAFAGAGDDEEGEEEDDDNRPSNHYDDEVDFM